MKIFDLKKVIEWLGVILKCPVCNTKYTSGQTKVIETEQDELANEAHILIHSDCSKCKSSVMFNIEIKGPDVFSVGMITDLTGKDTNKFKNLEPISVDEVISMHTDLKKFKGDFVRAFNSPNPAK